MLVRELPKPYLETAISLFKSRGLSRVVEIGSMRQPLEHGIEVVDRRCCLDGHSSMFFAAATDDLTTVDIDFWTSTNTAAAIKRTLGKYVNALCRDGIEFLKEYREPIDLLFLDAWDAFLPHSAERHLEAFEAAEPRLHARSIVLIDDTDAELQGEELVPAAETFGGKGRLVVPYMQSAGWTIIFTGRQTMLVREFTDAEREAVGRELAERRQATRSELQQKYPGLYSNE